MTVVGISEKLYERFLKAGIHPDKIKAIANLQLHSWIDNYEKFVNHGAAAREALNKLSEDDRKAIADARGPNLVQFDLYLKDQEDRHEHFGKPTERKPEMTEAEMIKKLSEAD